MITAKVSVTIAEEDGIDIGIDTIISGQPQDDVRMKTRDWLEKSLCLFDVEFKEIEIWRADGDAFGIGIIDRYGATMGEGSIIMREK